MDHYITEAEPKASRYSSRAAYLESMYKILFVVVLALVFALACVLFWTGSVYRIYAAQPSRFIGVNPETGEAFALRPNAIRIDPGEKSLRFALKEFTVWHAQRLAGRSEEDYLRSLLLMDQKFSARAARTPAMEEIKKVKQGSLEEQRVNNVNVVLRETKGDCKKLETPCRASVDFERTTLERGTDAPKEMKRVTAEIAFIRSDGCKEWQDNPLCLSITEYREYSQ